MKEDDLRLYSVVVCMIDGGQTPHGSQHESYTQASLDLDNDSIAKL